MSSPTRADETVIVTPTISFVSTSKHRYPGYPDASCWSIDLIDEYISFLMSKPQRSTTRISWGTHLVNESLNILGKSSCGSFDLFFAKFTSHSNNNGLWHGYPANHIKNTHDRPSSDLLRSLRSKNYLTKSQIKKIQSGKSI